MNTQALTAVTGCFHKAAGPGGVVATITSASGACADYDVGEEDSIWTCNVDNLGGTKASHVQGDSSEYSNDTSENNLAVIQPHEDDGGDGSTHVPGDSSKYSNDTSENILAVIQPQEDDGGDGSKY